MQLKRLLDIPVGMKAQITLFPKPGPAVDQEVAKIASIETLINGNISVKLDDGQAYECTEENGENVPIFDDIVRLWMMIC